MHIIGIVIIKPLHAPFINSAIERITPNAKRIIPQLVNDRDTLFSLGCLLVVVTLAVLFLLFLLPFFPPNEVEKDIPVPGMREVIRIFPVELKPMRKVLPPTEELKLFLPNVNRKGPDDLLRLNFIPINITSLYVFGQ